MFGETGDGEIEFHEASELTPDHIRPPEPILQRRRGSRYGPEGGEPRPMIYFPLSQDDVRTLSLVVRPRGSDADLASQVRAEVAALDASLPALEVVPMERELSQLLATRRFEIWALGAFGL